MLKTRSSYAAVYPKDQYSGPHAVLSQDSEEWRSAWRTLYAHYPAPAKANGTCAHCCPCCGECWQYMGTWKKGRLWLHEFRHRHHPLKQERIYANIAVQEVPHE